MFKTSLDEMSSFRPDWLGGGADEGAQLSVVLVANSCDDRLDNEELCEGVFLHGSPDGRRPRRRCQLPDRLRLRPGP